MFKGYLCLRGPFTLGNTCYSCDRYSYSWGTTNWWVPSMVSEMEPEHVCICWVTQEPHEGSNRKLRFGEGSGQEHSLSYSTQELNFRLKNKLNKKFLDVLDASKIELKQFLKNMNLIQAKKFLITVLTRAVWPEESVAFTHVPWARNFFTFFSSPSTAACHIPRSKSISYKKQQIPLPQITKMYKQLPNHKDCHDQNISQNGFFVLQELHVHISFTIPSSLYSVDDKKGKWGIRKNFYTCAFKIHM